MTLPESPQIEAGGKETALLILAKPRPIHEKPAPHAGESHDPASGPGAGLEIQRLVPGLLKVKGSQREKTGTSYLEGTGRSEGELQGILS